MTTQGLRCTQSPKQQKKITGTSVRKTGRQRRPPIPRFTIDNSAYRQACNHVPHPVLPLTIDPPPGDDWLALGALSALYAVRTTFDAVFKRLLSRLNTLT